MKIYITIILAIIIGFMLGRQCSKETTKVPIYKDTTIVKYDTIWPDTTKIEIPKPYSIHDTVLEIAYYEIPEDSIKLRAFFQKRVYERNYKSEDIEALVVDTLIGYLLDQKVSYKLFKPISIINNTNTIVTPQSTLIMTPKWEIKGGFDITPNNIYIDGELELNRNTYGLGLDPFNKIQGTNINQLKISYKRTLFRSKKGI